MEIDKGFQPLRNIRVDLSGPAAPSLDGSFMLIGPAREFGSAPAEDDQTAFKAIGDMCPFWTHSTDSPPTTETGWSVTMVRFGEVWQMLASFFAGRRGDDRSYYATYGRVLRSTNGAEKLAGLRF